MNDEIAQQMADALRENSEILRSLGQTQAVSIEMMKKLAQAQGVNIANLKSFDSDLKSAGSTTKQSTLYQKSQNQALEKYLQAQQNLTSAVTSSVTSMQSLATAFMSTEKGFSKFGSSLTSVGDAAWSLGKNFGLVGMAIGGLAKGATIAADAALKQTDASLKATDQLSALGAAGGLTTKEVLEMGHASGLTSKNIAMFTAAAAKAGTGLAGFGNTVTDGVKAFSKMTSVSVDQRMAFERMGISQERLMEMQGEYVDSQAKAGIGLRNQAKDSNKLQKESLEYVEVLMKLSSLTNKSVSKLQSQQDTLNLQYEELVATRAEQAKINRLEREGTKESLAEAERIKVDRDKRKAFQLAIAAQQGDKMGLLAGRMARTGTVDTQSASLLRLGITPESITESIKNAKDADEARENAAKINQTITEKVSDVNENLQTALQFGGEKFGEQFAIFQENLIEGGKRVGINETEAYKTATGQISKPSEGKTSKTVTDDPALNARNALTESEIAAKVKVDELVLAMNPMMSGFNSTTIAATALTAAATVAAAALAGMAAKSKLGDLIDSAGSKSPGAEGSKSPGAGKHPVNAAKLARGAVSGIGGFVGGMALDYGASKADQAGHTKTAGGLDAASYALQGASAGAMLASIVPGVGTAAGAVVGGAIGGAIGMYKNWDKMTGATEPGGKVGGAGEGTAAPDAGGKAVSGDGAVKAVLASGPGWIKLEKQDGGAIIRKGAANWRMNNPGNIRYGDFAKSHGAIGVGDAGPSGQFAVFPTLEAGLSAKEQLLFNPKSKYYNLSIWDAMHRYAPASDNNNPASYADLVAKSAGTNTQTLLRDLNSSQRSSMLDAINKHEGFREGITVSARNGAYINGPTSGFPVNLTAHGSEAVVPLDPSTLLGKLAKEPISSAASALGSTVNNTTSSNEVMISFMGDFRNMMEEKFDDILDALSEGNNISDKILTYSKV